MLNYSQILDRIQNSEMNIIAGDFLDAVDNGDFYLARVFLENGANVNARDELTGMSALHLAVATNNLPMAKLLRSDWNAAIQEDNLGRTPTVLAAQDYVDQALKTYIFEKECENYLAVLEELNGPIENWNVPNPPRRCPDIRSPFLCA